MKSINEIDIKFDQMKNLGSTALVGMKARRLGLMKQ